MDRATIVDISRISPDVRQYTVRLQDKKFDGLPGQHTVISKEDGFRKPYSVLTVKNKRAVFMIRDTQNGGVSTYMSERKVGDEINIKSNLTGNLTINSFERPVAFISTGTGVTPMIGMLQEYVQKGQRDAYFVFGDKNTDQLLYKDMLEQYEVIYDVQSTYVLSREEWSGRNGYVQEHIDEVIPDTHNETEIDFYVCGVPQMVVSTKEKLANLGVPEERIHSEGWEDGVT